MPIDGKEESHKAAKGYVTADAGAKAQSQKSLKGFQKETGDKVKSQKIAVLTSGGDAPGMNAAIRAVIRMANFHGIQTMGVMRGYQGLIGGEFIDMVPRSVSNVIQRGGTILKTSRSKEFRTASGLRKARVQLERHLIDGLIVIGGDGSYCGAIDLGKVWSGQIIGGI